MTTALNRAGNTIQTLVAVRTRMGGGPPSFRAHLPLGTAATKIVRLCPRNSVTLCAAV
jgi:hypothetical protein